MQDEERITELEQELADTKLDLEVEKMMRARDVEVLRCQRDKLQAKLFGEPT